MRPSISSSVSRIQWALLNGLIMASLTFPCPGASETAKPQPEPYLRISKPSSNHFELQIALRKFSPENKNHPDLWLVGVAHIGASNYFANLQGFLDQRNLVLYEGVGMEDRTSIQEAAVAEATQDQGSLQSVLAHSLGLAFQLEAINYDRKHFRNSDLSFAELQLLLIQEIEEGDLGDTLKTNPEFVALMAAMQGSSWMGALLHVGAKLLGSSPKLKAMTRLILIETLGQVKGDMSEMEGLPPDVQELLRVLIKARNEEVINDLSRSIGSSMPPEDIAVFYGAAHMDDLEKRILAQFEYSAESEKWLTAISVDTKKAGLSQAEIITIRRLIQWQMEGLGQGDSSVPTEKTPGKTGSENPPQ